MITECKWTFYFAAKGKEHWSAFLRKETGFQPKWDELWFPVEWAQAAVEKEAKTACDRRNGVGL